MKCGDDRSTSSNAESVSIKIVKAAIVQSSYIPWKGFFDIIHDVDVFVLYDDVQFTRRDWRNRNKIRAGQDLKWLTIPVKSKGNYYQKICETEISDPAWADQHWNQIKQFYRKAKCFDQVSELLAPCYEAAREETLLSRINYNFTVAIRDFLNIDTKIVWSMDYEVSGQKTDRLIALCQAIGADSYLSGPSARAYMEEEKFQAAGIELAYKDYSGYPEYRQLAEPFEHGVSIVDLLMNEGADAPRYIWDF